MSLIYNVIEYGKRLNEAINMHSRFKNYSSAVEVQIARKKYEAAVAEARSQIRRIK